MAEETSVLPNAFIGKLEAPTAKELTAALGAARVHWDQLLARLAAELNLVVEEWNSYSPKAGWALRLKMKKRNIVYLSPCQGGFRVSFVFGGKAVEAARQSTLPRRSSSWSRKASGIPRALGSAWKRLTAKTFPPS